MSQRLRLVDITAGYGGDAVVHRVSLSIGAGEFCALLGLNGSGKTTLLKTMCGLLSPEAGTCLVDDLDCTGFHEHRRARYISYIPQRHSAMEGVSVIDVVLMGLNPHLRVLESPSPAQRRTARDTLEEMGLGKLEHRDFARLSEGQKQMVILTRTLIQNAPVMLMDEPDSALDFLNRHQMLGRVRDLIHREGKAGLITLHDPNYALSYCDRLILLGDGAIVGDLPLEKSSKGEIARQLSQIYGDIVLLEHGGQYIMLKQ